MHMRVRVRIQVLIRVEGRNRDWIREVDSRGEQQGWVGEKDNANQQEGRTTGRGARLGEEVTRRRGQVGRQPSSHKVQQEKQGE